MSALTDSVRSEMQALLCNGLVNRASIDVRWLSESCKHSCAMASTDALFFAVTVRLSHLQVHQG